MKCSLFPFFLLAIRWGGGGDLGSGSGSKFNCAAQVGSGRVGSDDLGYGPGSGFSFEPVQTSTQTVAPRAAWRSNIEISVFGCIVCVCIWVSMVTCCFFRVFGSRVCEKMKAVDTFHRLGKFTEN